METPGENPSHLTLPCLLHGSYLQGMETDFLFHAGAKSWKIARILPTRNGNSFLCFIPENILVEEHGSYLQGMETFEDELVSMFPE